MPLPHQQAALIYTAAVQLRDTETAGLHAGDGVSTNRDVLCDRPDCVQWCVLTFEKSYLCSVLCQLSGMERDEILTAVVLRYRKFYVCGGNGGAYCERGARGIRDRGA